MTNDKWQFVVRTSDFYLSLVIGHWSFVIGHLSLVICHWSLVICHLTENPCQIAKDSRVSSTDPCLSVFIGSFIFSHFLAVRRGGDHERPETMVGHRVGSVTLLRGGSIAKENGGVREAL